MNSEILDSKIAYAKSNKFDFITLMDKSYEELKKMRLCISCSCGKDSVATAILCWLLNIPVFSIVRYDNGCDWSCMNDIWEKLKDLYSDRNTEFVLIKGENLLEQIYNDRRLYKFGFREYFGYCHCGSYTRFGTVQKQEALKKYEFENNCISIIGIASDENRARIKLNSYLLSELNISEQEALEVCYDYGFCWEQMTDFGFTINMYDYCNRLSCIYCGFANSTQLALYIAYFPFSVFANFERIQKRIDVPFKEWSSIYNLPEKLEGSVRAFRDNIPIRKVTKFIDSWSVIPY